LLLVAGAQYAPVEMGGIETVGVVQAGAAMMSALTLQASKAPMKKAESLTIWKILIYYNWNSLSFH